jgi:hypothetical protein
MLGGKTMFNKLKAASETGNIPDQGVPIQAGHRRLGKKPYLFAIAIVAIVIIAAAFFIPQGGATIPLNVNYVVGEKMVYDNTVTSTVDSYSAIPSFHSPNSTILTSQQTIEVIGLDGENYLLNHTYSFTILDKPLTFTVTEKMNKTGYSTYLLNVGNTQTEVPQSSSLTSSSYLAQLLSKPEAKVGDSINIPYPSLSSSIQTSGDLTVKFNGVEDLTVPAGTYKVFRIDMTSNNLKMTVNSQQTNSKLVLPSDLILSLNINFHTYLEYGTMRQIKSTMQETSSYQSSTLNMTSTTSMDTTLTQHIKP